MSSLLKFQTLANTFSQLDFGLEDTTEAEVDSKLHPFDERNIHPEISACSMRLFDDGHYSQSTFEAFKCVDKVVAKVAQSSKTGKALMMEAFKDTSPAIALTRMSNESETNEQEGFRFIFAGSIMAIRNPRGHEVGKVDQIEECLDHLGLASLLLRRLDDREAPPPP